MAFYGGVSPPLPNAAPTASPSVPPPHRPLGPWEWRLIGLLLVCFLFRNLPWRLDEFDQAKQAFVSLEMVGAGHWWFQHTPGDNLIATKPPLIGWLSAGLHSLLAGHWELAWRLPSLAAALTLAVLLWRAGEHLWPGRGGLVAMAAFGFNLLAPRLATLVRTDMPLTFLISAVGLIVWQHARDGGRPWTPRARWAVFALLLAAMMTKGPIVYAFLLPGLVAQTWLSRRRGQSVPLWGGWWHWTLPLLPFLAWLAWGMETVPGFREQVIGREFLGRFTVGAKAVHHNQPVYFYLPHLFARWLPWSALLLAVTIRARRAWPVICREAGTLWLVCWLAGGFVLLSLVPSKRTDRIFPVVPPLCLVLTALLARAQRPGPTATALPSTEPVPAVPPSEPIRWPWDWARATAAAGVALGVGTTVGGIALVYYYHENARASFAAKALASQPGREIGLVVAPPSPEEDQTMMVYLRQQAYLTPAEAIQRWSVGKLDAIVVNERTRQQLGGLLEPFAPSKPALTSATTTNKPAYLLLPRHTPPATPPPPRKPPGR